MSLPPFLPERDTYHPTELLDPDLLSENNILIPNRHTLRNFFQYLFLEISKILIQNTKIFCMSRFAIGYYMGGK